MSNTQNQKVGVALLSVVSNSTLVVLKLLVGLMIGSISVISEAIHSGVDLLAALIALFAVRVSGKPADTDHQFGHEKVENLSGSIEALLIFVAAGWIIFEAVRKLIHPEPLEAVGWGIGVMLISALANIAVSEMLFRVGRKTNSVALLADAWHLRTDVWTSAGVLCGLGVIWLGAEIMPRANLHLVDPIAALVVAALILRAAYELTMQSTVDLLDVSLPVDECDWIRGCGNGLGPQVRGIHDLRTRKAGHRRFIEFHLEMDAAMSVAESHEIADEIERRITTRLPHSHVVIHVEPSADPSGLP